ncbi:MAG: L,D-transpeptidase, partial [Simkaniaceae bacterium]|nr:L,D-transpeptidase [Simkaniaceae bacterium]
MAAAFLFIGGVGVVKFMKGKEVESQVSYNEVVESVPEAAVEIAAEPTIDEAESPMTFTPIVADLSADVDQIDRLFTTGPNKLPIVETVKYKSRVDWIQGRPAWIADYASHYKTSRHFIARSLNKKRDYFTQKVSSSDTFNVLRTDKDIRFHFVVDMTQCKMWFYYLDEETGDCELLKTYRVGLGAPDANAPSGTLTPLGKFTLEDKIAIYKPGIEGYVGNEKVEMVQIVGTRWIPFGYGFGIHAVPHLPDSETGEYREQTDSIGKYASNGCVRLQTDDMEEIFSIVITRPTTIEIVKEYQSSETLKDTGS